MKKTTSAILALLVLYFYGYTKKEKAKKLPFYGVWKQNDCTITLTHLGICQYKTLQQRYFADLVKYEKQAQIPSMLAIKEGDCYHITLGKNKGLGTHICVVVKEDTMFWKSDTMNFFMEYKRG